MSKQSKYLKNSFVGVVGKVAQVIGGYGALWLLTDMLAEEEYGSYVTAFTVVSIVVMVAQIGLKQATTQRVSELSVSDGADSKRYAGAAMTWVAVVSLGLAILSFFFAPLAAIFTDSIVVDWIRLLSILIPGIALVGISSGILQGYEHVSLSVILDGIAVQSLRLVGLIIVWFVWQSPVAVAIAIGISYYLPVFIFATLTRGWRYINFSAMTVSHLIYSGYLFMNSIVSKFSKNVDILLLSSLGTLSATGGYNVAWKIAIITLYGDQILTSTISPRLSKYLAANEVTELKVEFKQIRDLGLAVALGVLIIMTLFGRTFLVFFGNYAQYFDVLMVLTIGFVASAAFGVVGSTLVMAKRGRLVFFNTVVSVSSNIVLNVFLIPRYGTVGAAIATAFSIYVLWGSLAVVELKYVLDIYLWNPELFAIIAVITGSVVLQLQGVSQTRWLTVGLSGLLIVFLLYRQADFINSMMQSIPE